MANEVAEALHESKARGADVELKAMKSKQASFSPSLSLYLSLSLCRPNFSTIIIYAPVYRHTLPFSLEWRMFGPKADVLPPSGQEARPSAAYTELVCMLTCVTEKLNIECLRATQFSVLKGLREFSERPI